MESFESSLERLFGSKEKDTGEGQEIPADYEKTDAGEGRELLADYEETDTAGSWGILVDYEKTARQIIEDCFRRVSNVEFNLDNKIHGRTKEKIKSGMIVTAAFLVAFVVGILLMASKIGVVMFLLSMIAVVLFGACVLMGEHKELAYIDPLIKFQISVSDLKMRVVKEENNINENKKVFWNSQENGWEYPLSQQPSILEQIKVSERRMADYAIMQDEKMIKLKQYLYIAVAVLFTIDGSMALFAHSAAAIITFGDVSFGLTTLRVICAILAIVSCVLTLLLAKFVWSKNNLEITNLNLLVLPAGIPVFLILSFATGVLIWFAQIALMILVVALVIGCLCASTSAYE